MLTSEPSSPLRASRRRLWNLSAVFAGRDRLPQVVRLQAAASHPRGLLIAGAIDKAGPGAVRRRVSPARRFLLNLLVRARYRQATHERARLLAAVAESGLVDLGPDDELPRRAAPDQYAADEIRAALVLTRRTAEGLCALADTLVLRLPAVWAATDAGDCDEPRAMIFCEWTRRVVR